MKLMSFNIQHCLNFITREIDFEVMANCIKTCGAEIVALNEVYDTGEAEIFTAQTKKLSELTGLPYYHFAKAIDVEGNNPYGNGFLSAFPILSAESFLVPDPDDRVEGKRFETRCVMKVKLENGYTVLVTHFGLNPSEQANAVQTVLEHLEDEKCILMGDLNVRPENPILDPIRARMTDTAIKFTDPTLQSRPVDVPNRKIDYIFVSPDIEVVAADIPAIIASDHRPHTAEIA